MLLAKANPIYINQDKKAITLTATIVFDEDLAKFFFVVFMVLWFRVLNYFYTKLHSYNGIILRNLPKSACKHNTYNKF